MENSEGVRWKLIGRGVLGLFLILFGSLVLLSCILAVMESGLDVWSSHDTAVNGAFYAGRLIGRVLGGMLLVALGIFSLWKGIRIMKGASADGTGDSQGGVVSR